MFLDKVDLIERNELDAYTTVDHVSELCHQLVNVDRGGDHNCYRLQSVCDSNDSIKLCRECYVLRECRNHEGDSTAFSVNDVHYILFTPICISKNALIIALVNVLPANRIQGVKNGEFLVVELLCNWIQLDIDTVAVVGITGDDAGIFKRSHELKNLIGANRVQFVEVEHTGILRCRTNGSNLNMDRLKISVAVRNRIGKRCVGVLLPSILAPASSGRGVNVKSELLHAKDLACRRGVRHGSKNTGRNAVLCCKLQVCHG